MVSISHHCFKTKWCFTNKILNKKLVILAENILRQDNINRDETWSINKLQLEFLYDVFNHMKQGPENKLLFLQAELAIICRFKKFNIDPFEHYKNFLNSLNKEDIHIFFGYIVLYHSSCVVKISQTDDSATFICRWTKLFYYVLYKCNIKQGLFTMKPYFVTLSEFDKNIDWINKGKIGGKEKRIWAYKIMDFGTIEPKNACKVFTKICVVFLNDTLGLELESIKTNNT